MLRDENDLDADVERLLERAEASRHESPLFVLVHHDAASAVARHVADLSARVQTLPYPLTSVAAVQLATSFVIAASQRATTRHQRRHQRVKRDLQQLRSALDHHAIVAITDASGTILDVNAKFCELSQYRRDELIGRDHRVVNSGHHGRQFWSSMWATISRGDVWSGEVCNRARDGSRYWVQTTIVPLCNSRGRITRHLAIRTDVTQGKQVEHALSSAQQELEERVAERTQALQASRERYALAARGANDGLWDWDLTSDEIYYAERWKLMLGYSDLEISDKPEEWFSRVHPADVQQLLADIEVHRQVASDHFHNEHRLRRRDGSYAWMLCRALVVRDQSGQAIRLVGSIADITTRRAAEDQLRYKSLHDDLTDLPNRALFNERLDACIRRAHHNPSHRFAVVFLDLDRFKLINDCLGHDVGDQLLKQVAQRLRQAVTASDASTPRIRTYHTVARMGGDEFTVILDGIGETEAVERIADAIQANLSRPFRIGPHEVVTSASMGIRMSQPPDQATDTPLDADNILRDADTAMYTAKARGKAQHAIFGQDMHQQVRSRMELERDLRNALALGQLRLNYQPIISLESGDVRGFEALLRWHHPVRGDISPATFIPIAEELGIIVEIGAWVLRQACMQLNAWSQRVPDAAMLSMSVNLSRRQLLDPDFLKVVDEILSQAEIHPSQVNLEITESLIVDDPQTFTGTLNLLRELGVALHMDDFGTGHSSLSCLHRFPLDALKIDRAFIHNMGQRADYAAVVQAIVTLAHNLNMRVIAEGVELPEQLAQLQALECDDAQGWLLSAPLSAADAEAFLREPIPFARSA
ncbi:MAG: EAL domain-containing protein [Phycisphaeraceae bacterium]